MFDLVSFMMVLRSLTLRSDPVSRILCAFPVCRKYFLLFNKILLITKRKQNIKFVVLHSLYKNTVTDGVFVTFY